MGKKFKFILGALTDENNKNTGNFGRKNSQFVSPENRKLLSINFGNIIFTLENQN